jgi:hypothetical protein
MRRSLFALVALCLPVVAAPPDIVVFLSDDRSQLDCGACRPARAAQPRAEPQHAKQLATLRSELDAWMKSQGDTQQIAVEPRLLSDPKSYGPAAESVGKPNQKPAR